jgi:hypothetical protein
MSLLRCWSVDYPAADLTATMIKACLRRQEAQMGYGHSSLHFV